MRLLDKDGHPAREGLIGEFTVDPPHFAHKRNEQLQQAPPPALQQGAQPVPALSDEVDAVVEDMIATMHAAPGVGLIAQSRQWLPPRPCPLP